MQMEPSLMCPGVCCRSTIAIVMSPVGPYFPTGLKPISLFIDEHNVRAWPGGVGNNKVGTNYAPTIGPQSDAADMYGTSQVLYSFPQGSQPDDALVSECGAMNLMFFLQKVHAFGFVLVWIQDPALCHLALCVRASEHIRRLPCWQRTSMHCFQYEDRSIIDEHIVMFPDDSLGFLTVFCCWRHSVVGGWQHTRAGHPPFRWYHLARGDQGQCAAAHEGLGRI